MNPIPGEPSRFAVSADTAGKRLDVFLAGVLPEISRSSLRRAIDAQQVLLDGQPAKASSRLKSGQSIEVRSIPQATSGPQPAPIPLDVIHEDTALIAINKPPGMVVHPAKGHWQGTLASALVHHCQTLSAIGGAARPGIVHRLDRDTSGVLVAAKTDAAHMALASQFESRTVGKEYLAIVRGNPDRDADVIECAIGTHPYQREKMAIRETHATSRPAVTEYQVAARFRGFALLQVRPTTGRTHQIRVHLAHVGLPIVADRLYAGHARLVLHELHGNVPDESRGEIIIARQALHASCLRLQHPVTRETMEFTAALPGDLTRLLDALRTYR